MFIQNLNPFILLYIHINCILLCNVLICIFEDYFHKNSNTT